MSYCVQPDSDLSHRMENDLEEGEVLDSENEEESNKVRVALGAWPCYDLC